MGCVLARFVLLDCVAGNGESWFLARALGQLRSAISTMRTVVSYADPTAGHIGHVYAAMSSAYRGRTSSRRVWSIGKVTLSGRTLSKIRTQDRGHVGAITQLVRLGAPARRIDESPTQWLERLTRERVMTATTRPGLHAYCLEMTREARHAGRNLPRLPYPVVFDFPHPELPLVP